MSAPARNPLLRAGITVAAMALVAAGGVAVRAMLADGLFASVTPGFEGSCKAIALPVGGIAIDAAQKTAFLAIRDARRPGADDGIYALDLAGSGAPVRLAGTPKEFHPGAVSLWRGPDGALLLAAVNQRPGNRSSIDSFAVTRKDGAWTLSPQGTVMGGLLSDAQDVALVGPNNFYVSNGVTGRGGVMRWLQTHGVLPGGNIVYFNGTVLREVVTGIYGPHGLALSADGGHLLAATLTGRQLLLLSRESFTGNLSEGTSLDLPAAPDRIALDSDGNAWVAGHAKLSAWRAFADDPAVRPSSQIFKVTMKNGALQSATQVYGDDGSMIAGAQTGAALGKRLLIGAPLDGRLLDCGMAR